MTKETYTRRKVEALKPLILGRFHDLVCKYRVDEYEEMLDEWPDIDPDVRKELVEEFKRYAETVLRQNLRRKWRAPK